MVDEWSSEDFGDSYWGSETYNVVVNGRNISQAERSWDSPIDFSQRSTTNRLIEALSTELERVDDDLEEIYEQQHINSATGRELDKFGLLVGVERNTNEKDNAYRARIKAQFRASTMGPTWNNFTQFCSAVLDTDIDNINFTANLAGNPATIEVGAPPTVYNDIDLTNQEVQDILGDGVPAGHEVNALSSGANAFEVKADGATDDPDKGLTADGDPNGGTLVEDLI